RQNSLAGSRTPVLGPAGTDERPRQNRLPGVSPASAPSLAVAPLGPPTAASTLIGRQRPFADPGGFWTGRLGRRAANAQACFPALGLAGGGGTGRDSPLGACSLGGEGGAAGVSWSKSRGLRRPPDPSPSRRLHRQRSPRILYPRPKSLLPKMMNADMDVDAENQVELEEKTRLINQVLELQHTLEDLSARVDAVKEENLKLKSENQVLGQYIENLMSASSVFQTTDTKSKR
ncbi:Short coiled-coil protein, partial [Galemys pyrenaicus]